MIAAGQEVVGTALLAGLLVLRVGLAVYALVSGVRKGAQRESAGQATPDRAGSTGDGARDGPDRPRRRR